MMEMLREFLRDRIELIFDHDVLVVIVEALNEVSALAPASVWRKEFILK